MSTEEKSTRRSSFLTSHQIIDSTELELLGRWFEICNNYSHLHHLSFDYYRKVNYLMMMPIMIITTVTGSFNVVLSFYPTLIYIQIVLGVLGLIAGMISSMYNFLEIPQLQEQHNMFSARFEKYGRTIEMELVLYKNKSKTYASLAEFIKIIKSEIDHLVDHGPFIPSHILRNDSLRMNKHNTNEQILTVTPETPEERERKSSIDLQINNFEIEKGRSRKSLDTSDNSRIQLKSVLLDSI